MSKTETILLNLLPRLRREYIDHHPEVALSRREFEEQYASFRHTHRHNPRLLNAVENLLESQTGWEEIDGDCRFLLGLQMGLELGGVDMLGDFL